MVVVILVIVAALVVLSVGVIVAVRAGGRSKGQGAVAGEPIAPPAPAVATPTVDELEALLREPPADVAVAPEAEEPAATEVIERPRLRDRLGGTRKAFSGAFGRIRGRKIDDETWDELEESLILADVGMFTTTRLIDAVRTRAKETSATEPEQLIDGIMTDIKHFARGTPYNDDLTILAFQVY